MAATDVPLTADRTPSKREVRATGKQLYRNGGKKYKFRMSE